VILLNIEMDYPRKEGFSIFGGKRNGKVRKVIDGKKTVTKSFMFQQFCCNGEARNAREADDCYFFMIYRS